jgi:hypothetical protein
MAKTKSKTGKFKPFVFKNSEKESEKKFYTVGTSNTDILIDENPSDFDKREVVITKNIKFYLYKSDTRTVSFECFYNNKTDKVALVLTDNVISKDFMINSVCIMPTGGIFLILERLIEDPNMNSSYVEKKCIPIDPHCFIYKNNVIERLK